jgi:hypothetical protein
MSANENEEEEEEKQFPMCTGLRMIALELKKTNLLSYFLQTPVIISED